MDSIQSRKTQDRKPEDPAPQYRVNIASKIGEKAEGRAVMNFTFVVETEPDVVNFIVDGKATVTGSKPEVDNAFVSDSEKPPEVLQMVFQECLVTFYFLTKVMGVTQPRIPLPWGK